ncbi:Xanthosine triphosphate pyrophosphatase [Prochlorococcus marinus str. MIT 9301]|uniref:dITP/XTP pyrophosphatase n=2 Tax=Prochlorococcaceae TaxID=2881426 RepID=A3PB01_PROM0|nr:Xanthosine triphosphate pyrophosphatase [Prochlorococcus marinus str. MIT 9301]
MGSRIYKYGNKIRMKNLYLASKNKGKIEEYKKLLAGVNCKLLLQPESLEVEEDGLTFRDNAIKKASEVSRKTNNFSIADDSGICIEALGGKPGIYSSRYAENDQKRIERVLRELDGVQNRSAFFIANICICSPNGEVIIESEAKCHGNIILNPRGKSGFGYDPIFEESSTRLTFAEMNNDIKDSCSHRGKALKKIIPDLIEIFS